MAVAVIMPKLGQSVESCIITEWYKNVGDRVETGELLFAYETDKASFVYESKDDGVLLDIFFGVGQEVPVHTHVAVIGQPGEAYDNLKPGNKPVQEPEQDMQTGETAVSSAKPGKQDQPADKVRRISPRAHNLAQRLGVEKSNITGSGPQGRIIESDVQNYYENRPRITPLARAIMEQENIALDSTSVEPRKRVTSRDLTSAVIRDDEVEIVPLSNIRRIIAEGMQRSLQNAAQLTHHLSANASKLLELRRSVKERRLSGQDIPDININDMVCYTVIRALLKHPDINAHFLGDSLRRFRTVHLGMAVDTPRGLMVPVLQNAQQYDLRTLAARLKDLASRCQGGNIDPDLLQPDKASFTVTNLGVYGIEMFTPVLNLPQVGILGVNAVVERPAQDGRSGISLIPFIGLSLTYDHRAVDGAPASRFLMDVKKEIECIDMNV